MAQRALGVVRPLATARCAGGPVGSASGAARRGHAPADFRSTSNPRGPHKDAWKFCKHERFGPEREPLPLSTS